MKKGETYIRYENLLTDGEILSYALMLDKFKNGEINYKELENMFLILEITIEPVLVDFSKKMITSVEAGIIKERYSKQNYLYSDIVNFILNSSRFKNMIFAIDYKSIEVLANFGIPEYQKALISILKTQLRHSFDKDKNLAVKREEWKRKIAELESQLEAGKIMKSK